MRIVFCQSHESWIFSVNPLVFPNGMLYCAAVLEQAGHRVAIVDPLPYNLNLKRTLQKIKEFNPDIVGIYFTTDMRFKGFELITAIKQELKVITIAGGPHPTLCPENTLKNNPDLDIIIIGEAEFALPKVIENLGQGNINLKNIPNVAYRYKDEIIINKERYLIENLDTIPFPAYHLIPDLEIYNYYHYTVDKGKRRAMNVFAGRGCPFGCIFCASSHIWHRKVRFRSIENIMEQIRFLYNKYNIRHIGFFDETFNIKKNRIIELCEAIKKSDMDITWDCEIRADAVNKELLKIMKDSNCTYVCFGIESADEYIRNKVIGKKITNEKIFEVDRACYEIGLNCEVNLMISFPEEDYYQAEKTFELINKLKSRCHIQPTRIYPGTTLEKIAKQKGIIPENFDWSDPMAHKKNSCFYIPGMLGDYPLYLEKISPIYIFEKLFSLTRSDRWGMDRKKFPLWLLIKQYLSKINYYRDFIILLYAGIGFLKYKLKFYLKKLFKIT